jgi:hypothetical protein
MSDLIKQLVDKQKPTDRISDYILAVLCGIVISFLAASFI